MDYKYIIQLVSLILFAVSAYYIKKSESCPCPDADASRRNYLLYFSYFEIVYLSAKLALGSTFALLLLSYPVLYILPLFAVIGGLVWSFFTIQHVNAMKKCKCPESQVQELTYAFAILRLVAAGIVILLLGNIVLMYTSMSEKDRKEFMIGFKKGYIQRLKNQSKN
jgi:hypothetical protein